MERQVWVLSIVERSEIPRLRDRMAIEEQHSLMGNGARPLTYPLSRTTVAPKPYLR
jgi:hypothetical protein